MLQPDVALSLVSGHQVQVCMVALDPGAIMSQWLSLLESRALITVVFGEHCGESTVGIMALGSSVVLSGPVPGE